MQPLDERYRRGPRQPPSQNPQRPFHPPPPLPIDPYAPLPSPQPSYPSPSYDPYSYSQQIPYYPPPPPPLSSVPTAQVQIPIEQRLVNTGYIHPAQTAVNQNIPPQYPPKPSKQPSRASVLDSPSLRHMASDIPLIHTGGFKPASPKVKSPYKPLPSSSELNLFDPEERQSYQVRALSRKALSFQRRQWFTNICCIGLCPLLMVLVSSVVGFFIATVIKNQDRGFDILYCSERTSINEQNWPIFNLDSPGIATTPTGTVPRTSRPTKHANFYSTLMLAFNDLLDVTQLTKLGTQAFLPDIPCISWFGEAYPKDNANVYAKTLRKQKNAYALKDSAYTNEVASGWLDIFAPEILADPPALRQAISLAGQFAQYQMRPWALVAHGPRVDPTDIGTAPQQPILRNLSDIPTRINNGPEFPMFNPGSSSGGILDTIEPRWYVDVDMDALALKSLQQVPYFEIDATAFSTPAQLDVQLGKALNKAIQNIAAVDKQILFQSDRTSQEIIAFIQSVIRAAIDMPYGSIFFEELSHDLKRYKFTLGMGQDLRLASAPGFPTAGRRQALQLAQLSNGILRKGNPALSEAVITQGIRLFPQVSTGGIDLPVSTAIGKILYPFGVSFLLPIFTIVLVKEKEDRVLIMMRMNGLKPAIYYISQYITFYILYVVSAAIFLISGWVARLDMFARTDATVLIVLMIVWGGVQVSMAFFFASMFNKSRNALLITFLFVLCGVIISLVTNQLFTEKAPSSFFLWPPFAFYRCLAVINDAATSTRKRPYKLSNIKPGDEVFTALLFMAVEIVAFMILAGYLNEVLPGEYGPRKPWHYPITHWGAKRDRSVDTERSANSSMDLHDDNEDDDVREERQRVVSKRYDPACPLVVNQIHKVYAPRFGEKPKTAIKSISLALEPSTVFGLLGPNGAGKTTLISILTGLYTPTSGTALVGGYDITTSADQVYKLIGVCPQFDILWSELSVEEHVVFYARLKGVMPEDEPKVVKETLQSVRLLGFEDRLVKGLSGGEKRRLSIAIALVGDPRVVFLDEPTTGLDPEVRRIIWNIIDSAREGRTIVLTTHSMEEAEVCCHRIGIMSSGTLRCLGPQLHLKQLYGSGFKLTITASRQALPTTCQFVESQVLAGTDYKLVEVWATMAVWVFSPQWDGEIARVFEVLQERGVEWGVGDWGVEQATLDEVFVGVVGRELDE